MGLGNKGKILADIWNDICNFTFITTPLPHGLQSIAADTQDDPDELSDPTAPPSRGWSAIGGYHCIIAYQGAKGGLAHRRITCRTLERGGEREYLKAFCHERNAPRKFRCDRIDEVIDVESGEVLTAQEFIVQFKYDDVRSTRMEWGLNLHQRADLFSGLNALVFMARCDGNWHPLEENVLEKFITAFWIRREIEADLPLGQILQRARRLRPDAEAFFMALARCEKDRGLARLVQRHIQEVMDADGVHHDAEMFWGEKVDRFFAAEG